MNKKIGVIGAGNMGSVVCKAITEVLGREALLIADRNSEKCKGLDAHEIFEYPRDLMRRVDTVVLAVKPQGFDNLLKDCEDIDWKDKFVISIMAGLSIQTIQKKTGATRIVRAMPNVAMSVGEGTIGWVASESVTSGEKMLVQRIFGESGVAIELDDESLMDAFTVIAGSGPAYFFYLTELLAKKAVELGLSKSDAMRVAERVCIGAGELLEDTDKDATKWREAITSRGGTTEAAITALQESSFEKDFFVALDKAMERGGELAV
jgi:pyrroline-5-carboxylate reductase